MKIEQKQTEIPKNKLTITLYMSITLPDGYNKKTHEDISKIYAQAQSMVASANLN